MKKCLAALLLLSLLLLTGCSATVTLEGTYVCSKPPNKGEVHAFTSDGCVASIFLENGVETFRYSGNYQLEGGLLTLCDTKGMIYKCVTCFPAGKDAFILDGHYRMEHSK